MACSQLWQVPMHGAAPEESWGPVGDPEFSVRNTAGEAFTELRLQLLAKVARATSAHLSPCAKG